MMKSVLITGAAKNSGYGIARRFASEGWRVFITSRKAAEAEEAAARLQAEFPQAECWGIAYVISDVIQAEHVRQAVRERCPALDALILNAANLGIGMDPFAVPIEEWADVINTNVVGNFQCARLLAEDMVKEQRAGTVLFVGSTTAQRCLPGRSGYAASKGAIDALSKTLSLEWAPLGLRVNCLIPGAIRTDRYDGLDDETVRARNAAVPTGRICTAEDMANTAFFLSTEQSGNINGASLVLDGGVLCKAAF